MRILQRNLQCLVPCSAQKKYEVNARAVVSPTGCIVHASSSISNASKLSPNPSKLLGPSDAVFRLSCSASSLSAILDRFSVSRETPGIVRRNIRSMCLARSISWFVSGLRRPSLRGVRRALDGRSHWAYSPRNVGTKLTRFRGRICVSTLPLKMGTPAAWEAAFAFLFQSTTFIAPIASDIRRLGTSLAGLSWDLTLWRRVVVAP